LHRLYTRLLHFQHLDCGLQHRQIGLQPNLHRFQFGYFFLDRIRIHSRRWRRKRNARLGPQPFDESKWIGRRKFLTHAGKLGDWKRNQFRECRMTCQVEREYTGCLGEARHGKDKS
jgi:hypothetical protein